MLTIEEKKAVAVQALRRLRGDDLHRAEMKFKDCTPEEMQEQYGESGKTRAQIIEELEARERGLNEVIEWVEGLA